MHNRLSYLLLGLWVTLAVACGSIYDQGQCADFSQKITFRLSVADSATRTTWGDEYASTIGTSFDNMIRLDDMRVVIYSAADNTLVGEVASLIHWQVAENQYQFVGDMSHLGLTAGNEYKIMVYAACPNSATAEGMTFELTDLEYQNGAIPMWGVKQIALNLSDNQDIGTISLLRAAAKVEVTLGAALADYTIQSVTINSVNRYGYCLPSVWQSATETSDIVRSQSMNEYRSIYTPAGGVEFVALSPSSRVLYIPEYCNTDALTPSAKLSITLSDSSNNTITFNDAVSFATYTDGKVNEGTAYDIVRNNYYNFNITGIAGGLTIDYKVADWDDGEDINYGEFAYPTYHNPVIPDSLYYGGNINDSIEVEPTMSYNVANAEAGAFSVWFNMSAPLGQTWVPTFTQSQSDYQICVYKNGVLVTDPKEFKAGADWYNIKIIPLNAERAGNIVEFGISYTASWMSASTSMYLFINGKADAIAWKNSGNDPKIIKIKQI